MRHRFILCWLIVLFAVNNLAFAKDILDTSESPSLAMKFNFSNPTKKWKPSFGGGFEVDYSIARYFSLAGEIDVNSVNVVTIDGEEWHSGRAANIGFSLVPKIRIPFHIKSTVLVPYLAWHIGLGFGFVRGNFSMGEELGARLGSKLFFTDHWGMLLEYGFQLGLRNTNPAYIMMSHVSSLGLIYRF